MTSIQQRKAVRLVVGLLVASIATGVSFVVLTLVTHAATLGPNQILFFLVAILYVWVIRQLRAGSSSAYRRVRFVSAAGFVAVGWQLAAGAYPVWLRPIEAGQLALLAALIVAVNRPVMRAAFPRVPDPRPRNRRAALVLAVLAPLVAEATLGAVPLRMFWALLLFAPIYAGGALFLREAWRRTGGGYLNLLLLGVAYGLVEEGLALQSLTSPHLYGAAGWAPRLFGVNTDYTELNLVYHAVFSVTIPVVLVELLFRRHGAQPYLRRGGLIASGVIALLGAALIRVAVPPSADPGYTMPPAAIILVAALAIAFLILGLRLHPSPTKRSPADHLAADHLAADHLAPARPAANGLVADHLAADRLAAGHLAAGHLAAGRPAPARPAVLAVGAAVATFGFLALLWPFGDAVRHGWWPLLPMAGAAVIAVGALVLLRGRQLSPRDLVALCGGALVAHTVFGLVSNADSTADRLFLGAVAALTAMLGRQAAKTLARQPTDPIARPSAERPADPIARPSAEHPADPTARPSAEHPVDPIDQQPAEASTGQPEAAIGQQPDEAIGPQPAEALTGEPVEAIGQR